MVSDGALGDGHVLRPGIRPVVRVLQSGKAQGVDLSPVHHPAGGQQGQRPVAGHRLHGLEHRHVRVAVGGGQHPAFHGGPGQGGLVGVQLRPVLQQPQADGAVLAFAASGGHMPVGEENVRLLPGGAHGKPGAGPSDPPPGLPLRPQPVQMHHALPRRLHRLRLPGQRLRLIQHLRPAEQPGEAQQGRAGGVLPEGGEHIPQGGEVFALDQGPHPLHLPLLQLHPGGHIPEEAGVAQLHMEP